MSMENNARFTITLDYLTSLPIWVNNEWQFDYKSVEDKTKLIKRFVRKFYEREIAFETERGFMNALNYQFEYSIGELLLKEQYYEDLKNLKNSVSSTNSTATADGKVNDLPQARNDILLANGFLTSERVDASTNNVVNTNQKSFAEVDELISNVRDLQEEYFDSFDYLFMSFTTYANERSNFIW